MKKIFLLILIFANIVNVFAQDTIFHGAKEIYNSNRKPSKGHHSALEIIKFSDDYYKLEKCYYSYNKRVVHEWKTENYNFEHDSVLLISYENKNSEKWIYHKKNDTTYTVKQLKNNKVVLSGEVSQLMPFIRQGKFTSYNIDGNNCFYHYFKNNFCVKVEGKTMKLDTVLFFAEQMPKFLGGEAALRKYIAENLEYQPMPLVSDISGRVYARFVVTKVGEVANIEIVRSVDAILDMDVIRVISTLPNFKPGMQNGKPVNVWYTVSVDFQLN